MTTILDPATPCLSRDAGPDEFVGVYTADDGAKIPCTAKPSKRQAGKLKIEYGVVDILPPNMASGEPIQKRRTVWAIVDAGRVARK